MRDVQLQNETCRNGKNTSGTFTPQRAINPQINVFFPRNIYIFFLRPVEYICSGYLYIFDRITKFWVLECHDYLLYILVIYYMRN